MDSLDNYSGLLGAIRDSNEEHEEKLKGQSEEMKEKIKQLTDPIGEMFMGESSKEILKKTVNDALKKTVKGAANKFEGILKNQAKLNPDDINEAVGAFKKGGMKGLVNHLKNKQFGDETEKVGQQLEETNISDLAPEEFKATQGTIENAIIARRTALKDSNSRIAKNVDRKYNNERLDASSASAFKSNAFLANPLTEVCVCSPPTIPSSSSPVPNSCCEVFLKTLSAACLC